MGTTRTNTTTISSPLRCRRVRGRPHTHQRHRRDRCDPWRCDRCDPLSIYLSIRPKPGRQTATQVTAAMPRDSGRKGGWRASRQKLYVICDHDCVVMRAHGSVILGTLQCGQCGIWLTFADFIFNFNSLQGNSLCQSLLKSVYCCFLLRRRSICWFANLI